MNQDFMEGDTVIVGEDTAVIVKVDDVHKCVLIQYQGPCANDGAEEWRKMSEFIEGDDEST